MIGELIADGVITQLARSQSLRVISRLVDHRVSRSGSQAGGIKSHLDVGFVLSGGYTVLGDRVIITAELSDTRQPAKWCGPIAWRDPIADLMQPQSQLVRAAHRTQPARP